MIHQIVDAFGLEFVQDGHRDRSVGGGCEEADAPVGLVAGTEGHLVAFLQTALLEGDVQKPDSLGDILVLEGDSLVIGQGVILPMLLDALLDEFVY